MAALAFEVDWVAVGFTVLLGWGHKRIGAGARLRSGLPSAGLQDVPEQPAERSRAERRISELCEILQPFHVFV